MHRLGPTFLFPSFKSPDNGCHECPPSDLSPNSNIVPPLPPVNGSRYSDRAQLGEGAFSKVKEGTHRQTSKPYAIKIVTKSKLTREDEVALRDEIDVLKELKHPNIIRLYDVFDESQFYYLVTECLFGGELFDRIVSKSYYSEKEARDVCRILFQSMAYCHGRSIAHRDLKPENLLLQSETNDSEVKIADFGFAKKCLTPNCLSTQCGTPGYVAPEILEGVKYDMKSDMWSLGVITYILLGGYPPSSSRVRESSSARSDAASTSSTLNTGGKSPRRPRISSLPCSL